MFCEPSFCEGGLCESSFSLGSGHENDQNSNTCFSSEPPQASTAYRTRSHVVSQYTGNLIFAC